MGAEPIVNATADEATFEATFEAAVEAAVAERDDSYCAMRETIPDLAKPACDRAPLSPEQAAVRSRFVAAENRLRILRTPARQQILVDARI